MSEVRAAAQLLAEEMIQLLTDMDKVEMALVYGMNDALQLPFGARVECYLDQNPYRHFQTLSIVFKIDMESIQMRKDARDGLAFAKQRLKVVGVNDV